jgi:SAM-dependent methyltransferase
MPSPHPRAFDYEYFECGTISNYAGYVYSDIHESIAKGLIRHFAPNRHLDIGCAKGFVVHCLKKVGIDSVGMDVSSYALRNSPAEVRGLLVRADAEGGLPFRDSSFDLVTCMTTVEHLSDPRELVREVRRVLVPAGYLYLSTDDPESTSALSMISKDITHLNVRPFKYWVRLLRQEGFRTTRISIHTPKELRLFPISRYEPAIQNLLGLSPEIVSRHVREICSIYHQIRHHEQHVQMLGQKLPM